MTELSLKNRIIAAISFLVAAVILTYQDAYIFTAVYFSCTGLVVFLADKIFDREKIKEKMLCAFLITTISYQSLHSIFISSHDNTKQLLSAFAIAVFLAATFALTDKKKTPYAILSAPLLCFLDNKIALCYGLLLLIISSSKFCCELEVKSSARKNSSKNKKKSKKRPDKKQENSQLDPKFLFFLSAFTGLVCFTVCTVSALNEEQYFLEDFKHFVINYKNTFGILILTVYLLFRIFKSKLKPAVKITSFIGVILSLASGFFFLNIYGWSVFSLFCMVGTASVCLTCLDRDDIVQSIKENYGNSKYLFWVLLLLVIR